MPSRWLTALTLSLAAVVGGAADVRAQPSFTGDAEGKPSRDVPGLEKVGVDEQLEEKLPLELSFTDHTGKQVQLRDYFDGERPVLLTLNYYTCPVVCSMILESTARTMSEVPWTAGDEYEIVTISIDPEDTPERARNKRKEMLETYGKKPEDGDVGWHFLVGQKQNIQRVAEAVGFRYFYDERQEQYAHPAVVMFATPDGRLARYLYGLQYAVSDARIALLEASEGNSISTTEKAILYCYSYDPQEGGYTLVAWRVMQIGGGLTAVVLGAVLFFLWRRELKKKRANKDDPPERPLRPRQVQP